MVYPSVEDFIKRVNWLIGAANDNWGDEHKDKNPNQEVKKMSTKVSTSDKVKFYAKFIIKPKPKPKTSANPVKSAEQQAKLAKSKKVSFLSIFEFEKNNLFKLASRGASRRNA